MTEMNEPATLPPARPLPDPNEQIAVTMTRARWGAMLDYFSAKLQSGDVSAHEADLATHLACALISAGTSRMEHAIVEHMLRGELSTNDTP